MSLVTMKIMSIENNTSSYRGMCQNYFFFTLYELANQIWHNEESNLKFSENTLQNFKPRPIQLDLVSSNYIEVWHRQHVYMNTGQQLILANVLTQYKQRA
jgi:hypothetical protein